MMPICHSTAIKRWDFAKIYRRMATLRHNSFLYTGAAAAIGLRDEWGMVTAMCTATISTLTLATLLRDPLIQMVMRSDNVSHEDHSQLLYRVQDSLIARAAAQKPMFEASI